MAPLAKSFNSTFFRGFNQRPLSSRNLTRGYAVSESFCRNCQIRYMQVHTCPNRRTNTCRKKKETFDYPAALSCWLGIFPFSASPPFVLSFDFPASISFSEKGGAPHFVEKFVLNSRRDDEKLFFFFRVMNERVIFLRAALTNLTNKSQKETHKGHRVEMVQRLLSAPRKRAALGTRNYS